MRDPQTKSPRRDERRDLSAWVLLLALAVAGGLMLAKFLGFWS